MSKPKDPANAPRKLPQQERSRTTVDAILTAATQVFTERGYEEGTTQRIAEVAGVSIGTLYQYFPNKTSLLAALAEVQLERFFTLFQECMLSGDPTDFDHVLRSYVQTVLRVYEEEPLQHVLVATLSMRDMPLSDEHDRRALELVSGFLGMQRDRLRVAHPDIAAYLVVTTVRYATLCWARDQPDYDREQFIEELCDLVLGYLLAEPRPKRR